VRSARDSTVSLSAWIQAARPLAHANIAPPLLYGQALAYATYGTFAWHLLLAAQLFGLFDHLFIVFANDAADWQADRENTTFNRFSGGSRVTVEGKLTPGALAAASMLALGCMAAVSVYLVFGALRPFMLVACSLAAGLLWAYSFPPLRLSYRGGGEWLQGLGVGILLPVIGFYVQTGTVWPMPTPSLVGGFLLGLAGNVLTALPDTPADERTGKRTLPVRWAEAPARILVLCVTALGALGLALGAEQAPWALRIAVVALPLVPLTLAAPLLRTADASDHARCERFVGLVGSAITVAWLAGAAALALR
jgi:1,4-dihydroxy-2-naphthoate polyprenyltransferase